jgi:glutamate dehydrogenase/leucine dehydrogenase
LHDLLKQTGLVQKPVAAIGGFEEAYEFAKKAKLAGFKVVAVSDKESGLVDYGGNGGLNISKLKVFKKRGKDFRELEIEHVRHTKPEFLMRMEVDVLVPENSRGVLNESNAGEVRAKVVVATKKGLITREARRILEEKQIPVILVYS